MGDAAERMPAARVDVPPHPLPMSISYAEPSTANPAANQRPWVPWAIRGLAALAVALSAYLAVVSATERAAPAGCGPGSGCAAVLTSRWGQWFGLSVAWPALMIYGAILVASFLIGPATHPARRRGAWVFLCGAAALAAMAAIWFVVLQLFVIKSVCVWCTAVHACGLAIATLVWIGVPSARAGSEVVGAVSRYDPNAVPRVRTLSSATAGVLAVLVLIAGQLITGPAPARVEVGRMNVRDSGGNGAKGATRPAGDGSPAVTTTTPNVVRPPTDDTSDAPLDIDLADYPLVGPRSSRNVLVVMNDYTCPHCRELHHSIDQARERYGKDRFVTVVVPVPLHPRCNSTMIQEQFQHRYACELATLALAVWRADATKFPEYDRWLYEPLDPRTPEQARAHAAELVGEEKLATALKDPSVTRSISRNVGMYRRVGRGKLPKLFVDDGGDAGVERAAELFEVLEKRLGLRAIKTE